MRCEEVGGRGRQEGESNQCRREKPPQRVRKVERLWILRCGRCSSQGHLQVIPGHGGGMYTVHSFPAPSPKPLSCESSLQAVRRNTPCYEYAMAAIYCSMPFVVIMLPFCPLNMQLHTRLLSTTRRNEATRNRENDRCLHNLRHPFITPKNASVVPTRFRRWWCMYGSHRTFDRALRACSIHLVSIP